MKWARLMGILSLFLLTAPAFVAAQSNSDDILNAAYKSLAAGDYAGAARKGRVYQASNPRRFDADFVVAVGDCIAPTPTSAGVSELRTIIDDYVLDLATLNAVRYWMSRCRALPPKQPQQESNSGVGVVSSGLSVPPPRPSPENIRRPTIQPHAIPRMSALISATSFSGDDYRSMRATSPASCAQSCRYEAMCRSMTYIISARLCYLKRSVPPAQHGGDFVSALKHAQ